MSMTKQIAIGILATVSLGLFGIGSYYASRQLFPDPQNNTAVTPTPSSSFTSTAPTVGDMKKLEPRELGTKADGDNLVISYNTAEAVGTLLYVTPTKTEKIEQAMKDYNNGVPIAGRWFTVTPDSKANTAHSLAIPKSIVATTGDTYYYIVISYKNYWLPYGLTTDYQNGVAEPYTVKL